MASGRSAEAGDPRTPMAWQHRDLNYHQSGFQDRYGPGADNGRMGPSSNSDRLSHRTDKSWLTQRESTQGLAPQYGLQPPPSTLYPPRDYPGSRDYSSRHYPHSRDMSPSDHFSSPSHHHPAAPRQQHDSRHSGSESTISSSSTEDDNEQSHPPPGNPGMHAAYGYSNGYYPGYPPSQAGYAPSVVSPYHQGTLKSAKSVPALVAATYDGEPCPVHHGVMPGMPPGAPMSMPPMVHPGFATLGPPRRAASIYDMRLMSPPPPPTIYGTLPMPPPAHVAPDARSLVGCTIMGPAAPGAPLGIPAQLLPPMARPRPLVIGEGGTPEVLPVRGGNDKGASLTKALLASKAAAAAGTVSDNGKVKKSYCYRGGMCVTWIILGVVVMGILLTLMLLFIL